jgi:uncharacterized membrane protein
LILIIADVIIWVIAGIPIMGLIASTVLWVGFLILWIIGIINASNEKTEEIPIIGKFAEKFTF